MPRGNLISELWVMPAGKIFAVSVLLVPASAVATAILTILIGYVFSLGGVSPNSVVDLAKTGITPVGIFSALIFAPVIENALCSLWSIWLDDLGGSCWWKKPAVIATIAAIFHALLLWDLRPLGVFPGFFVISVFIVNVKNKKVGYVASVIHHASNNLIGLLLAHFWVARNL